MEHGDGEADPASIPGGLVLSRSTWPTGCGPPNGTLAAARPGDQQPATVVLLRDGSPVLGFASMGSGPHEKTFQGLINHAQFGMSVEEAVNKPDFFLPGYRPDGPSDPVRTGHDRFAGSATDVVSTPRRT